MKQSRSPEKKIRNSDETQEVEIDHSLSKMDTAELQKLPSGRLFPKVEATLEPDRYFLSKTQKAVNIMYGILEEINKAVPESPSNRVYRKEFNNLLGLAKKGVFKRVFKDKLAVCINIINNLQKFKLPGKCNERVGNVKRILEEEIKPKL